MLSGANFSRMSLEGQNFGGCELHNCDFIGADLRKADFSGADLHNSVFHHTDLRNCDFRDARNYLINPTENKLAKARFSWPEALALLEVLEIEVKVL